MFKRSSNRKQWTAICALSMAVNGVSFSAQGVQVVGPTGIIDPKFATFGGPTNSVDTELRGIVLWNYVGALFIAPDPDYLHLLIAGNKIKPPPGSYDATVFTGLDTKWQPVMKLEI